MTTDKLRGEYDCNNLELKSGRADQHVSDSSLDLYLTSREINCHGDNSEAHSSPVLMTVANCLSEVAAKLRVMGCVMLEESLSLPHNSMLGRITGGQSFRANTRTSGFSVSTLSDFVRLAILQSIKAQGSQIRYEVKMSTTLLDTLGQDYVECTYVLFPMFEHEKSFSPVVEQSYHTNTHTAVTFHTKVNGGVHHEV